MGKRNIACIYAVFVLLVAIPYSGRAQIIWTNYTAAGTGDGLGTNDVYTVAVEPNTDGDIIWAGGRPNETNGWVGGLSRFNRVTGVWTLFTSQNSSLPHDWIMDMAFDSEGNLWIGTKGGGLAKLAPPYGVNDWTVYGEGSGIGYRNIYEIVIDGEDNIWMGHGPPPPDGNSEKAMSVFDGTNTWQTFGTPTLAENAAYTIVIDDEGKKWCATKRQGIYIFDDNGTPFDTGDDSWTHITDADGIQPNFFNSNAGTYVNGQLWFGHDEGGGADVWDGTTWTNHLWDRWFRAITHDWRGYVWCGEKRGHADAQGIFVYNGTDWEFISELDGLPRNVINAITIDDPRGNVWIGHGNPTFDEGGLTLLEGKVPPQSTHVNRDRSFTVSEFRLDQNFPNPFNPETRIGYTLPIRSPVILRIHDGTGRLIRTLVDEQQSAGHRDVVWDGRDERGERVASGIYFYELMAGDWKQIKKMVLLK